MKSVSLLRRLRPPGLKSWGLVLAVGAALGCFAGAASAQMTALLSATVTVGASSDATQRGYRSGQFGTLSSSGFAVEGTNYQVTGIYLETESDDSQTLHLTYSTLSTAHLAEFRKLVLEVGDDDFVMSAADTVGAGETTWLESGLDWDGVTTVSIELARDMTAPRVASATVDDDTLAVTYNEPLDTASTPAGGDFTVNVGTGTAAVSSVSVSGRTVTLTLAEGVPCGPEVTLDYTPGTSPIRDANGNQAAALTGEDVENNGTVPLVTIATDKTEYTEGETMQFTVTRTCPLTGSLRVGLDWERTSGPVHRHNAVFPANVTIPASQQSVTFERSLNDDLQKTPDPGIFTITVKESSGYRTEEPSAAIYVAHDDNDVNMSVRFLGERTVVNEGEQTAVAIIAETGGTSGRTAGQAPSEPFHSGIGRSTGARCHGHGH